jgi:hypothetical protein
VLLALIWLPAGSVAQQTPAADYDLESSRWNGLSRFASSFQRAGIGVEPTETIDYSELTGDDVLVIVYPKQSLDVASLAEFVVDGGRILLADDFGRSGGLLDRLDITRQTDPDRLPHSRFVADRPELPLFQPEGVHPLLEGVETVVANHPSLLRHRGGPVVDYDEGDGGLVYDMNLGEGKVIVFGDASLLINHMIEVADNRRLVENAIAYACQGPGGSCRPRLLVGDFAQTGSYRPDDADTAGEISELIDSFNQTISEIQKQIPSSPLLYYLALLLAAGLVLYLATVYSLRAVRRYSEYVDDAVDDVPSPLSEFEWNVSRFGANRRETNFALPLSILKEIFEELLLKELGCWEVARSERPSIVQLAGQFRQKYLQDYPPSKQDRLEREIRQLLETYAQIPTRHRVFLDSDAYFSDRDLIKLYRRTMRALEIMGLQEEYERRTRSLV